MPYSLAELNALSQPEFRQALGAIFEQTPSIAERAWLLQPFDSVTDLHQKMLQVVATLSEAEQIALIQAHPDLGSKAKMADASVQEQAGAGLDRLSPEEFERLHRLNQIYRDKFGFPFIIAVKNHTKASILAAFEERIANSREAERTRALGEIGEIARFRLGNVVQEK